MHMSLAGPADQVAVERLLDEAFGAERKARPAYRLRDGLSPIPALSFVTRDEAGLLAGSIQFWPLVLTDAHGVTLPVALLGPVAVAHGMRNRGLGACMVRHGLEEARALGVKAVVLVGDPEYYGRFGFSCSETGGWAVPAPVERHRLLALRLDPAVDFPARATLSADLDAGACALPQGEQQEQDCRHRA